MDPNRQVIKDSGWLWRDVADGVVKSKDLSPSLRLRASLGDTPAASVATGPTETRPVTDWVDHTARLREGLPFAIQSPLTPPKLPPNVRRGNEENIELNILRAELRAEEGRRRSAQKREQALIKMVEGLCEFRSAVSR